MIKLRKAKKDDFEQYLDLRKEDILEYSKVVNIKNENAINLYKKIGFQIYSYEMDKEI